MKKIGAPGLHFHDLRHTGNHLAARTGATTKDLMARMGHDDMRAALIYQHAPKSRAGVRTVSVPGAIRADIVKHLLHRLHPVREVVEVCAAERAALRPGEHQRIRPVVDVGHQVLRRLARLHTRLPLLAFTPKPEVRSQLAMSWEGDVEGARAAYQRAIDSGPDQAPTAMRNLELLAQQGEK